MLKKPFILIRLLAFLFILFLVYGSLVPLEFRFIPLDEAVNRFKAIPFLNLSMNHRSDWAANFLLFIPIGFFLSGSLWFGSKSIRFFLSIIIFLFCSSLSFGIEFTQLYFPLRTVSQNDIVAQIIGGLSGIIFWWLWGEAFVSFYRQTYKDRGVIAVSEKLFWIYVFILVFYNIMPLDLTISPVEIYHKLKSGKVNFIPFLFYSGDPAQIIYDLLVDVFIWIPVSFLLLMTGKAKPYKAIIKTLQIALVLEVLQLFIYSRVSDVTDLITAIVGAVAGVYFFILLKKQPDTLAVRGRVIGRLIIPVSLFIIWLIVDIFIFWYPFHFDWDNTFIAERIRYAFSETPLTAYYFSSPYRAITEFMHKIGFFIPFGAILGWIVAILSQVSVSKKNHLWFVMVLLLPPVFIEGGQLAIIDKSVQLTDLFLEWIGVLIGFYGMLFIVKKTALDLDEELPNSINRENSAMVDNKLGSLKIFSPMILLLQSIGVVFVLTFTIYFITRLPMMPYNVLAIFGGSANLISIILFSVVLFSIGWGSAWLSKKLLKSDRVWFTGVLNTILLATFLFVLLYFSVSFESLEDILGSPIVAYRVGVDGYLGEWGVNIIQSIGLEFMHRVITPVELDIRFIALVGPLLITMAVMLASLGRAGYSTQNFSPVLFLKYSGIYFILFSPWFLFCKVITFDVTPTDNLTELIAHEGNFGIGGGGYLYLLLFLTGFLVAGFSLLHLKFRRRALFMVFSLILSMPVSWLLFKSGLEENIYKYESVFSGVDFLLGPNRSHHLPQIVLFWRWLLLYLSTLFIFSLTSRLYFKYISFNDRAGRQSEKSKSVQLFKSQVEFVNEVALESKTSSSEVINLILLNIKKDFEEGVISENDIKSLKSNHQLDVEPTINQQALILTPEAMSFAVHISEVFEVSLSHSIQKILDYFKETL